MFYFQTSNHIKDLGKFFLTRVTISSNHIFPFQTYHWKSHGYDSSGDSNRGWGTGVQQCPKLII